MLHTLAESIQTNGLFKGLLAWPYMGHATSTIVLFIAIFVLRWIINRSIADAEKIPGDQRRRIMVSVRNLLLVVLIIGLVTIWGAELRTAALSVFAIAAAIVIATKELIMCFSGSFLRTGSHSFKVGDRIEVGGIRGDVFDTTMLTTTLFEIGPGPNAHQSTGRTIQIPNSVFLTQSVINETATEDYVLHSLVVPVKVTDDLKAAEEALVRAALSECEIFLDRARMHMAQIGKAQGIEALSVEPRVSIHLPDPDRVNLMLRFPTPPRRKGRIEQAILRRYLEDMRAVRAKAAEEAKAEAAEAAAAAKTEPNPPG